MKVELFLSERTILSDAQWSCAERMNIVWRNGHDDDATLTRPDLQHGVNGDESFFVPVQLDDVSVDARFRDACLDYWFCVHKLDGG